jgi:hypothetical protein
MSAVNSDGATESLAKAIGDATFAPATTSHRTDFSLRRVCKSCFNSKGEQHGEADKAQEGFGEFIVAGSNSTVALNLLKEIL